MTVRIKSKDWLRSSIPGPRAPKYRNIKQRVEGISFDSKGELAEWTRLNYRLAAGEITDLKRQVKYVLCPPIRLPGESRASAVSLVVDFQYMEDGKLVVADWKGFETPASRIKRRLMRHVHGIDVHVVGGRK